MLLLLHVTVTTSESGFFPLSAGLLQDERFTVVCQTATGTVPTQAGGECRFILQRLVWVPVGGRRKREKLCDNRHK